MAESSSPVVARWELSRRLAARRKELGVDVKTITNALGFTRNYWSAVENDRTLIAEDKLRLLFDVLNFDETEQAELLALREDSRKKGWWDDFQVLSSENKRFYGMEYGASRIRAYDGHLIPGILQIEEYTRAVLEVDPVNSPVDIDRLAAVRRRRQDEILNAPIPDYLILISEAVLHQQLTSADVHKAQLTRVLEAAGGEKPNINVRVLTFDVNPGAIIGSSTLLFLEYQSPHVPVVAWQEAVRNVGAVDVGDDQFHQLDLTWADSIKRALPADASLELIEAIAHRV